MKKLQLSDWSHTHTHTHTEKAHDFWKLLGIAFDNDTYFVTWYWYNFCGPSMLNGAVVTIFPKFFGKIRFCVLLNEIVQNFACSIFIFQHDIDIVFWV